MNTERKLQLAYIYTPKSGDYKMMYPMMGEYVKFHNVAQLDNRSFAVAYRYEILFDTVKNSPAVNVRTRETLRTLCTSHNAKVQQPVYVDRCGIVSLYFATEAQLHNFAYFVINPLRKLSNAIPQAGEIVQQFDANLLLCGIPQIDGYFDVSTRTVWSWENVQEYGEYKLICRETVKDRDLQIDSTDTAIMRTADADKAENILLLGHSWAVEEEFTESDEVADVEVIL